MDEFPGNECDCGVCIHADTDVCEGCVDGDKYKNEEEEALAKEWIEELKPNKKEIK